MSMDIDIRLATKGRREPVFGVVDQLSYINTLYESEQGDLNRFGYTSEHHERSRALRAQLDTQQSARAEAVDNKRQSVLNEASLRSGLKRVKRDLDSTVPDVFADHPGLPVTREAFKPDGAIGRSTPKLLAYFTKIDAPLASLSPLLAKYNDGRDLYAEANTLRTELDQARSEKHVSIKKLPRETQKVLMLKGEALELIERFNRAGLRANEGDASKRALFNKDLILRARRRVRLPASPAQETPAATGS